MGCRCHRLRFNHESEMIALTEKGKKKVEPMNLCSSNTTLRYYKQRSRSGIFKSLSQSMILQFASLTTVFLSQPFIRASLFNLRITKTQLGPTLQEIYTQNFSEIPSCSSMADLMKLEKLSTANSSSDAFDIIENLKIQLLKEN